MRILCTLPNAADVINGVAFEHTDGGRLSADLDDAVAAGFLSIPGYQAVADVSAEEDAEAAKPSPRGRQSRG